MMMSRCKIHLWTAAFCSFRAPMLQRTKTNSAVLCYRKLGPAHFTVKAQASLLQITQPNLYFHVVTIYDILRSKGVPVGKRDYLTPFAKDVVPWSRPSSVDKP